MEFGRKICSTLDALRHNVFAPVRKMPTTPWENGRELLHIPYGETSENQYLDLYLPDSGEKLPLLVLIHGGGFVFGDSQTRQVQWMYRYFRQHGYVCASVNYRLAQEAPWPAAIADVKAAIRYLRANADGYGIDAGRIAVWGESAGGYLAAMAAVSEDDAFNEMQLVHRGTESVSAKVQVLVDYYGVSDFGDKSVDFTRNGIAGWLVRLANRWLTIPELAEGHFNSVDDFFIRMPYDAIPENEADVYCPAGYIKKLDIGSLKVILVHGESDITVPVQQTRRLENAFSAQIGEENVFAVYPHPCKHADDRLYSDSFLETIEEKMNCFLNISR